MMDKRTYRRFADAHAPRSPLGKNCLCAFLVGGSICALGELLGTLYREVLSLPDDAAGLLVSVTLIFLSVFLTSLGVFDEIARFAGAGTLVPITGFANAVVSPAIDSHAEGLILGIGAKIFTVAGPVLLYATLAGAVYGVILFVVGLF